MLNSVSLVGRLTTDPTLRQTKGENPVNVASFAIAVDRPGKDAGTDFIDVVAWRGTADFVSKFFKKGSLISITGELRQNQYTDKDGKKRSRLEVLAQNIRFCGPKASASDDSASAAPAPAPAAAPSAPATLDDDEDYPF